MINTPVGHKIKTSRCRPHYIDKYAFCTRCFDKKIHIFIISIWINFKQGIKIYIVFIITLCSRIKICEVFVLEKKQVVIIGGGPAGLTAAIYTRRSGLETLVLEKGICGGQINITAEIENYPGFKHSDGAALGAAFKEHADKFGTEFRDCIVNGISLDNGEKIVHTNKGDIAADALIIASGASFRKSGCKGELEFAGKGVSYCAVCDGAMTEELPVAVIGGGNTAVEEAHYLTQFADKVYVIHRRDEFRANKVAIDRTVANPKIECVMDSVVDEIAGDGIVEKVITRNVKTGEIREIEVNFVFVFVGTEPNLNFLDESSPIKRARGGWIIVNNEMETSVEGVFAAGDVCDKYLRQVVTACGDGAVAGMAAYDYLSHQYYLNSLIFEPAKAVALFTSSVEKPQIEIATAAESAAKAAGLKLASIDAHMNGRVCDKLGIKECPCVAVIEHGKLVKSTAVKSADEVITILKENQ